MIRLRIAVQGGFFSSLLLACVQLLRMGPCEQYVYASISFYESNFFIFLTIPGETTVWYLRQTTVRRIYFYRIYLIVVCLQSCKD